MSKVVLSILVNNTSGVLSRVAGLFSRRGYNIDSLTVGETEDPAFSRMTVSVTGDGIVLEQIEKQTGLDLRLFDDAMTFKIAMMVINYLKGNK